MKPSLNITSIDALQELGKEKSEFTIEIDFKLKNEGNSKANKINLYTSFLDWRLEKSKVLVTHSDLVFTELSDISAGEPGKITLNKYIPTSDFIKLFNTSGGLYLIAVCQWKGDNICYAFRTFETHMLLCLEPHMKDNKMVFVVKLLKKTHTTRWSIKNNLTPNILKLANDLSTGEVIYGERFREKFKY
jgi:hypothetical protein